MKTYVHIKSGRRYPQDGVASWFTTRSKGKKEHHIKPGYPECSNGWKPTKAKEWREEEIPDLCSPFTKVEWIAYADQYGDACAMQFLETCDYMKPFEASRMRRPDPDNEAEWTDPGNLQWFAKTFKCHLWNFEDYLMAAYGNHHSIDIIRFERHLADVFKYPRFKDGSMADFMKQKFGKENTERFRSLCLSPIPKP